MVKHTCNECHQPLPRNWRPVGTRTVSSVCPNCAVKHMKMKSERRRKVAATLTPAPEAVDAEPVVESLEIQ
ncbi:MAG: hypothetical protein AMXMBFR7_15350 [Planctomycetota bacterium]|nr:hypothetical protein [Planctomycetota bacterium]